MVSKVIKQVLDKREWNNWKQNELQRLIDKIFNF